jgi:hypothetical protein
MHCTALHCTALHCTAPMVGPQKEIGDEITRPKEPLDELYPAISFLQPFLLSVNIVFIPASILLLHKVLYQRCRLNNLTC